MRLVSCTSFVFLALCGAAGAQTVDPALIAPIHKFIDSFDKGDMAGAAAAHAIGPDLTIMDEVAPFVWRGPDAFQAWSTALGNEVKKQGLVDPKMTLSAATRVEKDGDAAYVVVPGVYSFKQGTKAMREPGHMTFVLKKNGADWLIQSWTWTGPRPPAASAPVKH